jgi:hypothetical protein
MKKAGLFILVIGVALTLFASFNFVTREKVVDLGSVEIMQNKNHTMSWSPILGVAMIVIGGGIYFFGNKKI